MFGSFGRLGFVAVIGCALVSVGFSDAKAPDWHQYRLMLSSFGPVRVGMTVPQAEKALGFSLALQEYSEVNPDCYYVSTTEQRHRGVSFMVIDHRIARIDVDDPGVRTLSGARIGMSEKQLKTLYKNLAVEPHQYDDRGHYLIFKPKDPPDQPYSLLFETDGQQVTTFRSGLKEPVGYVEGCL